MAMLMWSYVRTYKDPLTLITKPVTNLLTEIAGYVALALAVDYHIESGVTYKSLSLQARKAMLNLSINEVRCSSSLQRSNEAK